MQFPNDKLIFTPAEVDLERSPLRAGIQEETYILGAFNPGLARLPNGNLLIMVRVAEALRHPLADSHMRSIRWDPKDGYCLDAYPLAEVNADDPRKFRLLAHHSRVMALTSLSWLLPVELTPDGMDLVTIHYDKVIAPAKGYQEYGVEDARISKIGETYYMTTCSVSAERHSTVLYTSTDGLNYTLRGPVLDHQNKDMLYFEGLVDNRYYALTRPLGDLYFAYPPHSPWLPGPSINLGVSPDGLHWRPVETPLIRPRRGSTSAMKIGGGSQPVLTPEGWLLLYHGVEPGTLVGIYRTFWALLDAGNPARVLRVEDSAPLLEARPDLTEPLKDQMYVSDVVFTTGLADGGDHYVVASGEVDLACRITHVPKKVFK
jgi:beta-1,2-mannobiose phosphorylase / 1,2-beta-oligomannan phosphorylase